MRVQELTLFIIFLLMSPDSRPKRRCAYKTSALCVNISSLPRFSSCSTVRRCTTQATARTKCRCFKYLLPALI
ncbi:hypothetical protein T492DRAFT_951739 [Pavlovales sp. CCMP2436]|nr:hypothetical protein T492DRAFT_951739 [Pavlovales sp. CCMP2436]